MAEKGKRRKRDLKNRNLTKRGGVWYYARVVDGRRIRISLETGRLEKARARRDAYEEEEGIGLARPAFVPEAPTLCDFAARYLAEDAGDLAESTRRTRESHLREDGPILGPLGERRLDEITPAVLREWWGEQVETGTYRRGAKGRELARTAKTGREWVNTLAVVFDFARDLEVAETNPVHELRRMLRRRSRTKRARAEAESKAHPVETPEALARILAEARREGLDSYVYVLLALDAGLRRGEVVALQWGDVAWGASSDDPSRHLHIRRSRPIGGSLGPPKSGRSRKVALSRRLRAALQELSRARWNPGPEEPIVGALGDFYCREWRRILRRAGLARRPTKDLRDSYGSWLLSVGIPLHYISKQLGHAGTQVTERHYARWIPEGYVEPLRLGPGEVPADLLTRLPVLASDPTSDPIYTEETPGGDENVRDSADFMAPPGGLEPPTNGLGNRCSIL